MKGLACRTKADLLASSANLHFSALNYLQSLTSTHLYLLYPCKLTLSSSLPLQLPTDASHIVNAVPNRNRVFARVPTPFLQGKMTVELQVGVTLARLDQIQRLSPS